MKSMSIKKRCEIICARFQKQNPNPTTELHYQSPFELLIAVILSAQATDVSVNKATKALFATATTPEAFLDLGETCLKTYIKTIGLYNTKAKNIMKTCGILQEKHAGQVPSTRDALEALPGVGRKTANVILNTAFGELTIAVDTHIFRVANRLGIVHSKTVQGTEMQLLKVIPQKYLKNAHHWFILHGRYVCKARSPLCEHCLINDCCDYYQSLKPTPPE